MDRIKRSLEDQFFFNEDLKLMEKKRFLEQMKETKEAIKEVSGIQDEKVLKKLVELNIRPETMASLAIVPLLEVAWANGIIGREEKETVLDAVKRFGWASNSIDYKLLELWLEHKPEPSLLQAWMCYTEYVCKKMNTDEVENLKTEIMSHARAIAEVSGGILGIGSVSKNEKEMLQVIEDAFVVKGGRI
jgi:hypothetical protein